MDGKALGKVSFEWRECVYVPAQHRLSERIVSVFIHLALRSVMYIFGQFCPATPEALLESSNLSGKGVVGYAPFRMDTKYGPQTLSIRAETYLKECEIE